MSSSSACLEANLCCSLIWSCKCRCAQASSDPHKQGCAAEAQSSAQPAELVNALAQVTGIVQELQQETDASEQEGIARRGDTTQQTSDLRVHRGRTIKRKERSDKAALAARAQDIALLQVLKPP